MDRILNKDYFGKLCNADISRGLAIKEFRVTPNAIARNVAAKRRLPEAQVDWAGGACDTGRFIDGRKAGGRD